MYVPSAYRFEFGERGLITAVHPQPGFSSRVRAGKRRSKTAPVPVSVLFSPSAEFGQSLLVETNRGCGRGCRFCTAGWIHLPVRHALLDSFRKEVDDAVREGRQIGLIGSDLAGHPELESILQTIVDQGGTFSLSSIRPEGLSPRVIELLARAGQKTATLAPEVASPRAKRVIGKEIPSEKFHELVEKLVAAGIPNIRFYFMVGIPTETDEDVDQLVDFVLQSKKIFVDASRPLGRIGRLGVQINPFIPKPWTPFQWASMAAPKVSGRTYPNDPPTPHKGSQRGAARRISPAGRVSSCPFQGRPEDRTGSSSSGSAAGTLDRRLQTGGNRSDVLLASGTRSRGDFPVGLNRSWNLEAESTEGLRACSGFRKRGSMTGWRSVRGKDKRASSSRETPSAPPHPSDQE